MNPIYYIWRCMPNIISWLQISWDITPESKYLIVTDFMRYYIRIKISHGCRFHNILHQNQNISWLQISWDITPESKYPMAADFMRYYTRIKISHGCRSDEIFTTITISHGANFMRYYTITTIFYSWRFCDTLHQNHYIS